MYKFDFLPELLRDDSFSFQDHSIGPAVSFNHSRETKVHQHCFGHNIGGDMVDVVFCDAGGAFSVNG